MKRLKKQDNISDNSVHPSSDLKAETNINYFY